MTVISIGTLNVCANPLRPMPDVRARITQGAAISGISFGQEIQNGDYDAAWDSIMGDAGKVTYEQVTEIPISLPKSVWTVTDTEHIQVHGGLPHVSPARFLSVVRATRTSGEKVAFVNCHPVSKPRLLVPSGRWRIARWNEYHVAFAAKVAELHDAGYTVVCGGDMNKKASGIPVVHKLQKVLVSSGLDHLWVVPAQGMVVTGITARPPIPTTKLMDHPIVTADFTLTAAGAPVTPVVTPERDDRYDRVTFHGKTVNKITRAALLEAESRLGYELTIVQGSYHQGVGASAGTHDGGGVVDLAPFDWERKVKVMRTIGFAAWHRTAIKGVWNEHIHAVLIGDTDAAPAAQRQVTAYFNGRDGLKSNRMDSTWRPSPLPTFAYPPKMTPVPPAPPKPDPGKPGMVIDYSFAEPSTASLKRIETVGVMRYISNGSAKDLTKAEAARLHDAGLWIGLVWETTANRAGQGAAAGAADARAAEKAADALGYPAGAVIFYAVDYDAEPSAVQPYFHAIKAGAKRPVGIYGSYRIVSAGFCDYRWQATAWSHGERSKSAHLFQKVGGSIGGTDENDLLKPFPAWKP